MALKYRNAASGSGLTVLIDRVERWLDAERDQLPLWIPVGVGTGVALWEGSGESGVVGLLLIAAALATAGVLAGFERRISAVLIGAGIAIATGFAAIALKSALVAAPVLPKIWIGEFYGRIENVEVLSARDTVRLRLETDGYQGLPPKVRVNLAPDQYQPSFQPGAVIRLRARLMPPAGPALPGGYDFSRRAWFQEIGATGSALGAPVLHQQSATVPPFADTRMKLTRHILDQMPTESAAIGAALITGDQGHIAEADAQAMRDSGLAHLLSISGLHVTAAVAFIFLLVSRSLALWPWFALRVPVPLIAAAAGAIGAIGYTLLTGAEVPTVRSCIAALLVLTALALGREALTLRLVAFAALVVLLFWPDAMAGPSFQLSFAAVTTIVVLHDLPWVKRWTERRQESFARRIWRGLVSLVLTGLAIEVVLAPIGLYHFHKAGMYGALANVVAIPLTTFLIMPLEAIALLLDIFGLGAPAWWIAGQLVSLILALAHWVSALPGAVSMLPSMPDWGFVLIILGALIFGLLKTRVRMLGFIPFAIGFSAMILAPRPDMLVTGDGKHLALVMPDGGISLLRARTGDYVRDMLLENAGTSEAPVPIEAWPGVRCSPDICVFGITREGREWRVMATRTRYHVPSMEMAAACNRVDIIVSERWLPYSCKPRWIKVDRNLLEQSGGLAFYLPFGRVESVNDDNGHLPWVQAARAAKAQAALDQ